MWIRDEYRRDGTGNGKQLVRSGTVREFPTGRYTGAGQGF
jgi:hypothetical protein